MEDVEAYLEAQVEAAAKAQSESEKKTEGSNGAGNGDDGRSRDRKDRDKDREKDRDKDRERGRDSGRDRDRKRSRSRSRDRDRKRRSKSRSRSRERRSRRSRSRDRKAKSLSPIKDERTKEQKELDELTKDQRTVFVSQLVMKANEKDLQRFFGNFGKVRSVVMIRDKATNRHKGFAYVEMADLEIIPSVLLMNNQVPDFQKFPIAVAASRAERNYLAKQEAKTGVKTTSTGPGDRGPVANRVFLGNLHPNITEHDIRELLSPFGTVTQISLQTNEHGLPRGYAFASFSRPEEAQAVMAQLGGVMLADRPLRVGPATESGSASARASGNWRLDDDEGSGMHMNAQGRVALMAKLGHTAGMQIQAPVMPVLPPIGGGVGMPYPSVGSAGPPPMNGLPSPAILVRNMFDPATETEEGWADDIRLDVEEECSKHGRVLHIHVETQLPGGLVYLFFADLPSATKSATALHGRWFAGRMITVDYLQPEAYLAKFPEAARG